LASARANGRIAHLVDRQDGGLEVVWSFLATRPDASASLRFLTRSSRVVK
jgi:hypothetical protein